MACGGFVQACDVFKECESSTSERTVVPSCCVLGIGIKYKWRQYDEPYWKHTTVPTEALEYLSNHFSWLSLLLWEWRIITYYQVLCNMNNVQFLPVPCIIYPEIVLWFLLHTLMHGKLNLFLRKKKQPQIKPSNKLNELFNNLPWWKMSIDGKKLTHQGK